ncbi:hypothetical protein BRC2024_PQPTKSFJ_CDS_0062 [Tegunavirus sp. BRC001]
MYTNAANPPAIGIPKNQNSVIANKILSSHLSFDCFMMFVSR